MSFTQDELQAFHTVLEQRLAVQRRELERSMEQRFNGLRREFEQRLLVAQQETIQTLIQRLGEQQSKQSNTLNYRIDALQTQLLQDVGREVGKREQQQQQRLETVIQNGLAAQLLAIEQLLQQSLPVLIPSDENEQVVYGKETGPEFESIEVQTEISWEDLAEVVGKVLDERLVALNETSRTALKSLEQNLSIDISALRNEISHQKTLPQNGTIHNLQEVFTSIEQLERLIESMQMAMTSNHSLLSNRLFHHQQLPLERAHPASQENAAQEVPPVQRGPLVRFTEREITEDSQ